MTNTAPNQSTYALQPTHLPLLAPSTYLLSHLSSSPPSRPSKRRLLEARPLAINTGSLTHAHGSALVRTEGTSVVCGIRGEILTLDEADVPTAMKTARTESEDWDYSDETGQEEIRTRNLLVPNIELATGCSPSFMPGGPPSTLAQSLSQRLLSLLHVSRLIEADNLRIWHTPTNTTRDSSGGDDSMDTDAPASDDEGIDTTPKLRAYWTLYIDVVVISLSGNAFDAAWLAVLGALRDTLLPRAWWDADREMVLCSDVASEAKKISLRGSPVPLSYSVFAPDEGLLEQLRASHKTATMTPANKQDGIIIPTTSSEAIAWILVDPDAFEESLCQESGTLVVHVVDSYAYERVMRKDGKDEKRVEITKIEKSGGGMIGPAELKYLLEAAKARALEWRLAFAQVEDGSEDGDEQLEWRLRPE